MWWSRIGLALSCLVRRADGIVSGVNYALTFSRFAARRSLARGKGDKFSCVYGCFYSAKIIYFWKCLQCIASQDCTVPMENFMRALKMLPFIQFP